jgi:hypothetical protein
MHVTDLCNQTNKLGNIYIYMYVQCRFQCQLKQVQFFMSSITISLLILSRLSCREFLVCLSNLKCCVNPFIDSNPYRDKDFFLFSKTPRPHLGSTHSCISANLMVSLCSALPSKNCYSSDAGLLKTGPICFPEMAVTNCKSALRKLPEEGMSHIQGGRCLISCIMV